MSMWSNSCMNPSHHSVTLQYGGLSAWGKINNNDKQPENITGRVVRAADKRQRITAIRAGTLFTDMTR